MAQRIWRFGLVSVLLATGCDTQATDPSESPAVDDDASVDDTAADEASTPGDTGVVASDSAPVDTGPACAADGEKCSASTDCCEGSYCFSNKKCGRCTDPAHPQYCPQLGGGCWSPGVACNTVIDCGSGGKWGCSYSFLTYDCSTKRCNCPKDYPVWCAEKGSMPAQCWATGADCSTRVTCSDGETVACWSGTYYDCATGKCISGTVTPPDTATVPTWLVGTYSRFGKQENNVYFTSDDRSVTFNADGSYSHQQGKSSASSGKFSVSGDVLSFTSGALSGTTLNLKSSFDSTCRILYGLGSALWRKSEIPSCPRFARVASSDCGYVGTFTKDDKSGSFNSSGDGTETTYTTTVTLFRDRFYTYDYSSFKTTCYGGTCKSLANQMQTTVGDWDVSGGAPPFSLSTLTAYPWKLTKSTSACPGP